MSNAANTQFVLFGEQHGVEQLGPFIGFVYDQLAPSGFSTLGLELDSWTIQTMQDQGVESFIAKYPNSIAFGYDGELQLLQNVTSAQRPDTGELLGVDQMLTAIHPFQRLIELAESNNASRLARGAFLKAALKMGGYLREEHYADIEALAANFEDQNSSEIRQILDELNISMKIYTTWRAGQRGEVSRRKSPEMRENMMKQKFDAWWGAGREGDDLKKGIFKLGGAHLMYGIGPNGILTLGDHIRQQAESKGLGTLALGIRNFNPETALVSIEDFNGKDALVVDNRLLRQELANNDISIPNHEQNKLSIEGFDAIVYFKDAKWSKSSVLSRHKQQFRRGMINSVIPVGVFLLLCLTSVFVYAIQLFRQQEAGAPPAIACVGAFALSSLVIFQLLAIRSIVPYAATIMPAGSSFSIFLLLFLFGGYYLSLAFRNFATRRYGMVFRSYYLLMAISFIVLTGYCYYWNIGGMLYN